MSYDRVMSRVYSDSRSSLKPSYSVQRHGSSSSVSIGAKSSNLKGNSIVFSDLPTVLNDYNPEPVRERVFKRSTVVKPKKTVKSLDTSKVLRQHLTKPRVVNNNELRSTGSAPNVSKQNDESWFDSHIRECYSSRSHKKLRELKAEIKAFHETEKLMKLRSRLYKNCGIVLDDVGQVAQDKAVQAEVADIKSENTRPIQRDDGKDAGTIVPDQQMRPVPYVYPVDRYLNESSKKFKFVNIDDDEIWNSEPVMRPEDEIVLRKLHDMLQSTADDLKLLSGELSKFREPGVQVKSSPIPFDEEFNEKIHVEEVVNAKFHGYKIVDKTAAPVKHKTPQYIVDGPRNSRVKVAIPQKPPLKTNVLPAPKKPTNIKKKLSISRTRIVQIDSDENQENLAENEAKEKKQEVKPCVSYNQFHFKYEEPVKKCSILDTFQIQHMPSINIRSELKEQQVLSLDIAPSIDKVKEIESKTNLNVISITHDTPVINETTFVKPTIEQQYQQPININKGKMLRKFAKLSAGDSSESTNYSIDSQLKLKTHKFSTKYKMSPKSSARYDKHKGTKLFNKDSEKSSQRTIDEWKRKLNSTYGQGTSSKQAKSIAKGRSHNKKTQTKIQKTSVKPKEILNNSEYIPYSHLTVGGVRASDIEKEISDIPNKNQIPLSPILDKIISSKENSFSKSPKKSKKKESPRILTTSDEKLFQEVVDIERTVSETLSKNFKKNHIQTVEKEQGKTSSSESDETNENVSYADDFEDYRSDEKSIQSDEQEEQHTKNKKSGNTVQENKPQKMESKSDSSDNDYEGSDKPPPPNQNLHNQTYTKTTNLSFKDTVDVFEFIHLVDMQDSATQSAATQIISLKETQTSPRNEGTNQNLHSIHNELWPSVDPEKEIDKMFKLEKDMIKKLIIEEYGDLLAKPSTSKDNESKKLTVEEKNMTFHQKNTQTSPARAKCVMTSPTSYKTRTTSPITLSINVDHQTSPLIFVTNDEELKVEIEKEAEDISINLSSPRFSLRLPSTYRDVVSNLGLAESMPSENEDRKVSSRKSQKPLSSKNIVQTPSSSSIDAYNSSSEISSLGEIKLKLKRRLARRVYKTSESSLSSSSKSSLEAQSSAILPLRSEGELSAGQLNRSTRKKPSDGEIYS